MRQALLICYMLIKKTSTMGSATISSKGSDPSVYVLLYMFASYHLPPQQFYRAHASSYQPTTQSPSFHQPRHTLQTHSSPPPAGNSFVPTVLTPHPTNTGVSEKWCWCVSYQLEDMGNLGKRKQGTDFHPLRRHYYFGFINLSIFARYAFSKLISFNKLSISDFSTSRTPL